MHYTWVSSAGGPLLVAPQSALSLWTGADSTDGPVESRACAIDGYVGVVAIGQRQALALCDEPAMTTYLPSERLFLRWSATYEEDDLVSAARRAVRDGVNSDAEEDVRWAGGRDGRDVRFGVARRRVELSRTPPL
ncbi:Imm21 family immunity protein [Micromonospora musae]|uniref:Imm21 family immunity protein n=1 Tax=Micromonospora musae TaxID=1894970 RepID=UPI001F2B6F3E|nr:Imm21 family immunity protein [Micromonospora musae]